METANFLSTPGQRSWFSVVLLLLAFALPACDTLKTRRDLPPTGKSGRPADPPQAQPAPPPTVAVPVPATPPQPPAQQAPPTFLNKELPKVGVILGPGSLKAYAHIGALREFARARIPIHAITGLEWGALIGGLYAQQGQVNDAEWKAFKLKESDLPNEGGFLSSRMKPESIGVMQGFIDSTFGNTSIERSKVEFGCPAFWSKQDRFGWMSKGPYKDAMRACLPYPPFFTDNGGVFAAPFSVEEAAAHLRARGANLIVLVNVLGQGEILSSRMASELSSDNLLWSEIRREMLRAKSPSVHFVINVNTSGHPITDFGGRRALMDAGAKSAADVVNKMVSQYGF